LRRYIAEEDPTHAAVLLEQSLTAIEKAKATMDKAPDNAPKRGEVGRGRENRSDNIRPNKGGTSKDRLAAKIKRDHPDIAARVANGEFKSIRAAALEAGIVKPMRSIPVDTPDAAIRALLRVKARLRCEDPACGIAGPNPDARLGKWVSANFADTYSRRLYEARRIWEVFGQRQEEVARFAPHH
jgi:hypothetical protein